MSVGRYLAGLARAQPNSSPVGWTLARRPVDAPPGTAGADAPWETLRELPGATLDEARAEVEAPAPGEFRPHDLVRLRAPDGTEHHWFVRSDGRVARTAASLWAAWVAPWRAAVRGEYLLRMAAGAGVERGVLAGLAARMILAAGGDPDNDAAVDRALDALHLNDGAPPDTAAVRAALRLDPDEVPGNGSEWDALRAAVLSLLWFLEGRGPLEDVAIYAAHAVSFSGEPPFSVDPDEIREGRGEARREARGRQADLVRSVIPVRALLEAATEGPP